MSKRPAPDGALYVKLPATAVDKLDRAAETLGMRKKDLVAGLVTKYVDPDSARGLDSLGRLSQPLRGALNDGGGPTQGAYSFHADELPDVLTAEQAGSFLQLDEAAVKDLAERRQLPGRKLAGQWRFSRAALLAWLSTSEPSPKRSRR